MGKIIVSILTFSWVALAVPFSSIDLDTYLGNAQYFYNGKASLQPARIYQDRLYVAPVEKHFQRYIITLSDRPSSALFTIYKDIDGNYYSYFWDSGFLRTEKAFADPIEQKYKFHANSWVQLAQDEEELSGVFYPGDSSEMKFWLRFEPQAVTLTIEENAQSGGGLFPQKSVHRFVIAPN